MSFDYQFEFDNDEVYFAYCIPYTYSDLLTFIREIKNDEIVQEGKLCISLGGLDVPILTITDFKKQSKNDMDKRYLVLINSRIHPGETNSSWVC